MPHVRTTVVAVLVLLTAIAGATTADAARTQLPPLPKIASSCVESDFTTDSRTVRARLCPDGASPARRVPAVIVMHGCGGFGTLDQTLAHRLPEHGIATDYVDYFGLTPPPSRKGFCDAHRAVQGAFATWLRIARAATQALEHTPAVDAKHVGAVGWSLGGAVSLIAAERYRRLFAALVVFSAAAFGPDQQDVAGLPPTLRPLGRERRRRAGGRCGRAVPGASPRARDGRATRLPAREPPVEARAVRRRSTVDGRLPRPSALSRGLLPERSP